MSSYFRDYIDSLGSALSKVEVCGADGATLAAEDGMARWCELTRAVQVRDAKQVLCGNGASAAFANHMALDWTKNGRVQTMSFSDSALLTAVANDLGTEQLFKLPLEWYGRQGDLLVAISSSGNSRNIIAGIAAARQLGLAVVTLTGLKPENPTRALGDLNFYVPARTYGIVECAHQVLLHLWLDQFMGIEEWGRTDYQDMRKESFRL